MRVWAPDLAGLFIEAARGMYALTGARPAAEPPENRAYKVSGPDLESLLVAFLSELVYAAEQERRALTRIRAVIIETSGIWTLTAEAETTKLLSLDKAVKAVTYHKMRINESGRGYDVNVVFDV